ncbi:uncharacterized protein LOC141901438 [Tubulanus polymorphus]|uniref:uncharacterized protein LOC141901438 n=1 Tax=Tubulanus polymorphus TaxID=672921 RepID=UPI003DA48773
MFKNLLRSFAKPSKNTKRTSKSAAKYELTGNKTQIDNDSIRQDEACSNGALKAERSENPSQPKKQVRLPMDEHVVVLHICPNAHATETDSEFPLQVFSNDPATSSTTAKNGRKTQKIGDSIKNYATVPCTNHRYPSSSNYSNGCTTPAIKPCIKQPVPHIEPKGSTDNYNVYLEDGRVFMFAHRRPRDYLMWCSYACMVIAFPFGLMALLLTLSSREDMKNSNNVLTNSARLKRDVASLVLMIGLITLITAVSTTLCLNLHVFLPASTTSKPTVASPRHSKPNYGDIESIYQSAKRDHRSENKVDNSRLELGS